MRITVTDPSLVLLVGPSGSGKSTFAGRHFAPRSILSSDALREVIAGDANDQAASAEAFRVLALLLEGRLRRRLLSVVDATNLRADSRRRSVRLARRYGVAAVAICFDLPLDEYLALNRVRPDRRVADGVVRIQFERMAATMAGLPGEGFDAVFVLHDPAQVAAAEVEVVPAGP